RWRWKWQAQEPEDVDEDEPFFADKITGFRGAYAVNHPVQGSCAEVMMIALTRLDRALRGEASELGAAGLGRECRVALVHCQKLPSRFEFSIRVTSRSARSVKASSVRISAAEACSRSRS